MGVLVVPYTYTGNCYLTGGNYINVHDALVASILGTGARATNWWSGTYFGVRRGGAAFDTSEMGGAVPVSARYLFHSWLQHEDDPGQGVFHLVEGLFNIPMVLADYATLLAAVVSGGSLTQAEMTPSRLMVLDLNPTGLGFINPAGITKLGFRLSGDINADEPTGDNNEGFSEGGGICRPIADATTNITSSTARLNGTFKGVYGGPPCLEVTYVGADPPFPRCFFWCGKSAPYDEFETPKQTGRTVLDPFYADITGLEPNTHYYVRAVVERALGVFMTSLYGWFDTLPLVAPTVTTEPATNVEAETATINGTLDDDGGEACDCGFEWGLTAAYGNTTPTQSRTTGQTFSQLISGLSPDTLYHFRAFATNATGTGYGADRTFTTLIAPNAYGSILSFTTTAVPGGATVMTLPATHITESAARLHGKVFDDAGKMGDVRFQWGLTRKYGANTSWVGGHVTGDEFEYDLNNLTEGMGYHFRAQFKNPGIVSGQDMVFHTLSPVGPLILITEDQAYLLEASI